MLKQIDSYVYNTSNILGSGASSTVYLGSCLITNEPVAIRTIALNTLSPITLKVLQNEMEVLNSFLTPHPNILKVHKIVTTENNVYIVSEKCDARLTVENLENLDMGAVAKGIIEGMRHLYCLKIAHRDIKTENIMLKDGVPKIIDFGFAKHLTHNQEILTQVLGTPFYMAPQVMGYQLHTSKADIWSLGVTLYELLYKTLPFVARQDQDFLQTVLTTKPKFYSKNALTEIIKGCLVVEETGRLSWEDVFAMSDRLGKRKEIREGSNSPQMRTVLTPRNSLTQIEFPVVGIGKVDLGMRKRISSKSNFAL